MRPETASKKKSQDASDLLLQQERSQQYPCSLILADLIQVLVAPPRNRNDLHSLILAVKILMEAIFNFRKNLL